MGKYFQCWVLFIWIMTLVKREDYWNIQGLNAAMLPSHLSTTSDWRHIQAIAPIVFFEILNIKRMVIKFRMYDMDNDGTIDFKVHYCSIKTWELLVFLWLPFWPTILFDYSKEFLLVLTVMGGNSAEMKLRQIFRFPIWYFPDLMDSQDLRCWSEWLDI